MSGRTTRRASTVLAAAAAVAAALAPGGARGAPPGCTVGAAGALAFGVYDPLAPAPADSSSTISYSCKPGARARISLDAGLTGSFAARELRMGPERLLYNLFLDAARTIVWGDGTGGSQTGPGVITHGAGGTTTAYVFARIPAGQDAVVGAYADTVRVSFEF